MIRTGLAACALAGLGLLSGCASNNGSCEQREPLLSRLGLRNHNRDCCPTEVVGTPVNGGSCCGAVGVQGPVLGEPPVISTVPPYTPSTIYGPAPTAPGVPTYPAPSAPLPSGPPEAAVPGPTPLTPSTPPALAPVPGGPYATPMPADPSGPASRRR